MARVFTVLFVDDDRTVREPVAELLRSEGFGVLTAGSSLAAIPILAREHVDVLFADIVMPDQDGIELAKQASYSRAANAEKIGKLLFKPLRAHEIKAAIDAVSREES